MKHVQFSKIWESMLEICATIVEVDPFSKALLFECNCEECNRTHEMLLDFSQLLKLHSTQKRKQTTILSKSVFLARRNSFAQITTSRLIINEPSTSTFSLSKKQITLTHQNQKIKNSHNDNNNNNNNNNNTFNNNNNGNGVEMNAKYKAKEEKEEALRQQQQQQQQQPFVIYESHLLDLLINSIDEFFNSISTVQKIFKVLLVCCRETSIIHFKRFLIQFNLVKYCFSKKLFFF